MATALDSLSSSGQYINIDALVTNAVRVQQQRVNDLQSQQAKNTTKISSLGQVKSQIASLEDKFNAISKAMSNVNVTGAPTGFTTTATGSGTYAVSIDNLASSQIITAKNASSEGALGFSGTLQLDTGTYDSNNVFTTGANGGKSINVESGDTLEDIAKKINNSGSGISASIITGSDGKHISFSNSATGAENAFKISATDSGGSGISALAYNQGDSSNYNNIQEAKDGKATVNGVTINSSTNDFKVSNTFSFNASSTFTSQTINVKRDDAGVTKAIGDFVTAYNTTEKNLNGMDIDNSLKSFTNNLRKTLGNTDFANNITNIGLTFDKSGVLTFDSAKYNKFATSNPGGLTNLISKQFSTTSAGTKLFDRLDNAGGDIDNKVEALNNNAKKLSNSLASAQTILTAQKQSYQIQFSKLDTYLSQLNENSNSVASLVKQFSNNSSS